MEYKMRDFVTHEELTADNLIRCLNGYLNTVAVIDKDETENLLLYIDTALTLGVADLAHAAIEIIKADFFGRYC